MGRAHLVTTLLEGIFAGQGTVTEVTQKVDHSAQYLPPSRISLNGDLSVTSVKSTLTWHVMDTDTLGHLFGSMETVTLPLTSWRGGGAGVADA